MQGKGGKDRVVLLAASTWGLLQGLRGEAGDDRPVFPSGRGGGAMGRVLLLPSYAYPSAKRMRSRPMPVQKLRIAECDVFSKTGIRSQQLIWSNNAPDAQVTITHVVMEPGSLSKRHAHTASEQIWIVERGEGLLLLANDQTERLSAGDIIRTPAGEVHGVENTGTEALAYLAVTTPPQNFLHAYNPAPSGGS